MLKPDEFKQAIQTIEALGATPGVLAKVYGLASDPDTELDTICSLLRNDGPLAADIIRIANSPYYAPISRHSNLTSAVICIGMREVIVVVNLSLSCRLFARDLAQYGISAYDYWSLSVATALLMEGLASHTGVNREDAFTVGLLHAIGRLLINRVMERKALKATWDRQQPIEEWERNLVGFDFATAGAMLLEHWHFPDTTCGIIRAQLQPEPTIPPVSLLAALKFSRRLLTQTGLNFEKKDWQLSADDPFVLATELTHEAMSGIIAVCQKNFEMIVHAVGMERLRSKKAAEPAG